MLSCTLNEIRAKHPCQDGWTNLLAHLGKTKSDEARVPLATVLDSNGLDDVLWVLENVIQNRRIISLFAADCAERVLPIFELELPNDDRPRKAIAVARDKGATDKDRAAAGDAAGATAQAAQASGAAALAAWAAAWAAWAAALAAGDAGDAGDAAVGAAEAAAEAAGAAGDAGDARAARAAQKARLQQYITHGEEAASMPWPEGDQ